MTRLPNCLTDPTPEQLAEAKRKGAGVAFIRDARGKIPNYAVVGDRMVHQPTGVSVPLRGAVGMAAMRAAQARCKAAAYAVAYGLPAGKGGAPSDASAPPREQVDARLLAWWQAQGRAERIGLVDDARDRILPGRRL